jgi:hypothetical protein
MNEQIASILKSKIEHLNFVDKIAGMVRPMIIDMQDKDNKLIKKLLPIASDITAEQCRGGRYNDLIPNSKYKSILYFEDNGTSFSYKAKNRAYFSSKLSLVCWLNLKKLQDCDVTVISPQVILMIIAAWPEFPFEYGIYREISIKSISENVKNSGIFNKYSYDESLNQYLLWPYDYFSLQISVEYWIGLNCINDITITECTC